MYNNILRITEEELFNVIKEATLATLRNTSIKNKDDVSSFLCGLSKEDVERLWSDYRRIYKATTYSNPVTIAMMSHVNEGLIKTYPIEKTIEYIKSYFNLYDGQIVQKTGENDISYIGVIIPTIGDNIKLIKKAMGACGYYLGSPKEENIPENDWVWLQFEPKIQEKVSEQLRNKEKTLLHLTPAYNVGKINKIGFSPRCKNDLFNFPSRVYFLLGSTRKEEVINIGRQLFNSNNSLGNNGEYALFTFDVSKIPIDVELFLDPNYPHGVYTNSNIKPDTIIGFEKITF